jgi:chemotaxis protein CheD
MAEYIGNEFTYLFPGELIVTREALKLSTILGSCVSVCLFDPIRRIAGMNHFLLPLNKQNDPNQLKYGDTSLKYMFSQMLVLGADVDSIIARVYGGSSTFDNARHSFNIGLQNIEIAMDFLLQKKIPIKGTETGGKIGRKIVFDTSAGVISSSLLKSQHN